MYRFVLALALIIVLCSSINGQSQEPSPDQVQVNDRTSDVESEPLNFAGDDPAVSFSLEGATNSFFGTGAGLQNTTGTFNSFVGANAGYSNTAGGLNSFFGSGSGYSNTTGNNNSFFGFASGYSNTTANNNSFFGYASGNHNTTGTGNSFLGTSAGYQNTTGNGNSFFGYTAGNENTTGSLNSFFGSGSGYSNTTGAENSFFGGRAGEYNTIGYHNSFFGQNAGEHNTVGYNNSFFGRYAGFQNTAGAANCFFGTGAGLSNTVEYMNTFVGYGANLNPGLDPAGAPVINATAIGANAYVTQSNSLVLGSIADNNDATSYVNVGIGTPAPARQLHLAGPQAVFRMDRTTDTAAFIIHRMDASGNPLKTFVVGTNASGVNQGEFIINDVGTAVGGVGNRRMTITNEGNVQFTGWVSAAGFSQTSSLAFKTNVRTYENALDTVSRLRGVRFDWKDSGKPALGLIAEEVDQVIPEVVAHDGGTASGVNYANLVAVLVEAVKEQQKTIDEQQATNQRQQQTIEHQGARLEALERLLDQREP